MAPAGARRVLSSTWKVRGPVSCRSGPGVPSLLQAELRFPPTPHTHAGAITRSPHSVRQGWDPFPGWSGCQVISLCQAGLYSHPPAGLSAGSFASAIPGRVLFTQWSGLCVPSLRQVGKRPTLQQQRAPSPLPLPGGAGAPSPAGVGADFHISARQGKGPVHRWSGRMVSSLHQADLRSRGLLERRRIPSFTPGNAGDPSHAGAGVGSTPFAMWGGGLVPCWRGRRVPCLSQKGMVS